MKKIIAIVVAALMGTTAAVAQATQGDIATGANIVYGFGVKSLGVGAKFQYTFIDHVRGEVGFNYFFKKDFVTMWDASVNAHYLINVHHENLYLYPIAGLTFASLLGGSALLLRYVDPYTIFGSAVSLSIFGIIFLIGKDFNFCLET